MSLNKVQLIGNLGQAPDAKTTPTGLSVCTLSIATNERRKDAQGNWIDHTEWHRVVCFGKIAENAAKYLVKGSKVYIEGKMRTRKWQDKDGRDRWTTEIQADVIDFLDPKPGHGAQRQPTGQPTGQSSGFDDTQAFEDGSEVPF